MREAGHTACHYHGGMEAEDRRDRRTPFPRERRLIVVATVAFGMGVTSPTSVGLPMLICPRVIEAYYQEIGRAGRDGAPAETLTLFGPDDIRLRRSQIDEGLAPPERRAADHARLNALLGLAEALECRRQNLLGYFGEDRSTCGQCDLCDTPPETFDATTAVRKALVGASADRGMVWRGSSDRHPARGATRQNHAARSRCAADLWRGQRIRPPPMAGDISANDGPRSDAPDPDRHGALRMTEARSRSYAAKQRSTLRRDSIKAARRRAPAVKMQMVSEEDAPLLSALKAKRRALAEAATCPAYIIFNDRTLIEMAEKRPADLDGMARIGGVGAKKLDSYGDAFLEVINGASEEVHPMRRKLAGRDEGALYDRLLEVQTALSRGTMGADKPMSCSASLIAKVAQVKPNDTGGMTRLLGDKRAARFGDAFLQVLREA